VPTLPGTTTGPVQKVVTKVVTVKLRQLGAGKWKCEYFQGLELAPQFELELRTRWLTRFG
jgi:hypothetical protein